MKPHRDWPWVGWARTFRFRDSGRHGRKQVPRCRGGWQVACVGETATEVCRLLAGLVDPAEQEACALPRGVHPEDLYRRVRPVRPMTRREPSCE